MARSTRHERTLAPSHDVTRHLARMAPRCVVDIERDAACNHPKLESWSAGSDPLWLILPCMLLGWPVGPWNEAAQNKHGGGKCRLLVSIRSCHRGQEAPSPSLVGCAAVPGAFPQAPTPACILLVRRSRGPLARRLGAWATQVKPADRALEDHPVRARAAVVTDPLDQRAVRLDELPLMVAAVRHVSKSLSRFGRVCGTDESSQAEQHLDLRVSD